MFTTTTTITPFAESDEELNALLEQYKTMETDAHKKTLAAEHRKSELHQQAQRFQRLQTELATKRGQYQAEHQGITTCASHSHCDQWISPSADEAHLEQIRLRAEMIRTISKDHGFTGFNIETMGDDDAKRFARRLEGAIEQAERGYREVKAALQSKEQNLTDEIQKLRTDQSANQSERGMKRARKVCRCVYWVLRNTVLTCPSDRFRRRTSASYSRSFISSKSYRVTKVNTTDSRHNSNNKRRP